MSKKGIFFAAVLVFCVILGSGRLFADVFAKENEAESLYGKGVHAFFDADYRGAIKLLTKVKELGSEDPRPYYFLGLAQNRLGEDDKAETTFKTAAKFEWEGRSARDYNVSDALKRVQGVERLYVESFRRQAKLDWEKADQNRQKEKYGKEQDESKSILARMAKGSELPPPEPSRFVGVAPFGARSIDPLPGADEDSKLIPANDNAPAPLPKPVAAKTEDGEEPAGTATTKPKKEDDEDPFGASTDEKTEEPAGMATTSQAKEDKEDDEDPFGASSSDEKKEEPAGKATTKPKTEDDEDPFGASTDEKKEEPAGKATTKPKTEDDEDPFGASTDEKKEEPAGMATTSDAKEEKKDDDDPFGASSDTEKKDDEPKKDEKKEEKKADDDDDPFK